MNFDFSDDQRRIAQRNTKIPRPGIAADITACALLGAKVTMPGRMERHGPAGCGAT